jgi:CRISPR-associated protein Csx10
MRVITYHVNLLEPVLVTALGADPNSDVAFDYIPGSVLRGAIIGRYLRQQSVADVAGDPNSRRLFFEGTTRFLNGYPVMNKKRALPTPLSWQQDKEEVGKQTDDNPAPLFDFAIEPLDNRDKQWKGVGKPFCVIGEANVRFVQPERNIAVHTARTRRFGRAMPEELIKKEEGDTRGAVYRYDALAAGQTFEAMILCEDGDAKKFQDLLNGELTLGGSRTSGYGRVTLMNANVLSGDTWRETGTNQIADADGKLIITLLSDTLVRDNNGQFVVDAKAVTEALERQLKVTTGTLGNPQSFLRGEVIGGFNRKWGLPLPQTLAIKMGSVFVYEENNAIPEPQLRELERNSIGERRAEGFGRVAVNWHTEPVWVVDATKSKETVNPLNLDANSDSGKLAKLMVSRMLRRRLDDLVVKSAADPGSHIRKPKNSQISRLRNIVQSSLQQEPATGRDRLKNYFDSLESRKSTRDQFTRERIGNQNLLEWLRTRVTDERDVWAVVGSESTPKPKIGANVMTDFTAEMVYEYNLRLIDAVLARAAKSKRQRGES